MGGGSSTGVSLGSRVRYAFDNFMARGGLSVFLAVLTLFLIGFVVMAILRVISGVVWPDETAPTMADGVWRTFLEIADAGNIGDDSDAPYLSKGVGVLTIFVGMILFSSMVAFITAQFEAKLEQLRKGKSDVIETGHSLILGFGDRVTDIIRELIVGNESEKDAAVVVLADKDKEEMDDFFNDVISERKTTRIITRAGSIATIASLQRVGVDRARSVTILSEARSGDPAEDKTRADAKVLKAIMAVVAAIGEEGLPPVVAELHSANNRKLAESIVPGRITTMAEDTLLAKILVQTSRVSGLALVYSNLVGFEGNEVYFFRPKSGWPQLTFGQLLYHFPCSVPLGLRQAGGTLKLNPPADYLLTPEDEAIVLAEDDSAIGFTPVPAYTAQVQPLANLRQTKQTERHLLVGWTGKSAMIITEYARYLPPGSVIHVAVGEVPTERQVEFELLREQCPNVELAFAYLDLSEPDVLARIAPHHYHNVIIQTHEGATPEEADAATIAVLLRFRQYFRSYEEAKGRRPATQLITEVMDSDNTELVLRAGVKDYLISNQFVSKIFAQVAQEPDVKRIYDDLFSEEGSEIYLKPAELYFAQLPITLPFGDCIAAAQARAEVCFGYRLAAEERDETKAYGVHIIPNKKEQVTLGPGDSLITLAEDET